MFKEKTLQIALVGNPNSGKSSLFNSLTGLNQHVGNFPGVTVDKKMGSIHLPNGLHAQITDLPGTYSLYPKRADEWVAYKVLMKQDKDVRPDIVLLVADASNLKRNLLFCSQIIDLKIPVVMALTMVDIATQKGTKVDIPGLERELGIPVVAVNPRKDKGIAALKKALSNITESLQQQPFRDFVNIEGNSLSAVRELQQRFPAVGNYEAIHYLINHENFNFGTEDQDYIEKVEERHQFNHTRTQADEIMQRFARIKQVMQQSVVESDPLKKSLITEKLDNILLHRFWGYIILMAVLFLLFQSVFWIAQYPMDGIEWVFSQLSGWLSGILPAGWFSDLIVNGFIAGLSGIVVFVPQIMILFGLITLLEDTGYMARISFLTDKLMRRAGLNGKSVMPMISGFACAVPAIMSARNIENKKERLLTILVTPLMSCSARLPVYFILTSLVIPQVYFLGFISLRGLVMMALYLLGVILALTISWIAKHFIRSTERSYFILELPVYRNPRWKNVLTTMINKAKVFVTEAGKIILIISLILWGLSSYGPAKKMQSVRDHYAEQVSRNPGNAAELARAENMALLENSFAGHLGHLIEPAIRPLGYDWKIGIALITSFAAREVFVGTMATLYSVGTTDDEQNTTLRQKMAAATWPNGAPVYTLATGLSLLIFYLIAMQCMSTLAIVKKETRSWKWPLIQLGYLTVLAYALSFLVYRLFL